MNDLVRPGESPFDAIRREDEHGEHWTGRDLMPVMAYPTWQHFRPVIERAMQAAKNTGMDVTSHFTVNRETPENGGPAREDYRLTRYAAYLVAMNGDPRKEEVAEAQSYFAVKTREAEVREQDRAPATIELSLDEYERILDGGKQVVAELRATRQALETSQQELDENRAYIEHIEPDAEAYQNIVKDDGRDFDVRKTASFLTRSDPRISIGQKQLFEKLRQWKLIDRWNVPYREWSHLVTSMPKKFTDPHTGERRWAPKDQVRVTWAGLGWMRNKLLGEIEKAAAEKATQQRDLFNQTNGDNVRPLPARRDDDRPGGAA